MFERVLYVSRAIPGLTFFDVYDIIRTALKENSKRGLTGALLVADGYFIQVLEGQAGAVQECFQRIETDNRHTSIQLRLRHPIAALAFPSDWMVLRDGVQVNSALRKSFAYEPGFPASRFPPETLMAFMLECFGKPKGYYIRSSPIRAA